MNWFRKKIDLTKRVGGLRKSLYLRGRPGFLTVSSDWVQPTWPIMDGVAFIDRETDDQGQTATCGPYMVSNWCAAVRYMQGGVSDDRAYDPAALYREAGGTGDNGTTLEGCLDAAWRMGWIHNTAQVFDVRSFAELYFWLPKTRYAWLGITVDTNWQYIGSDGVLKPGGTPLPNAGHALLVCGCKPGWVLALTCWGDFGLNLNGVRGYIWIPEETFAARILDCHVVYKSLGAGVVGI